MRISTFRLGSILGLFSLVTPGWVGAAPTAAPAPAGAAAAVAPSAAADVVSALIPKRETGTPEFLKAHPTYDGRGVVIAIFDTGVDPSAAGLQTTSTGEPKVIEVIDATGAGDVDLSAPLKPGSDGKLAGRTGRPLTLPGGLTNPSGEYRLGLKPARDLFGGEVMDRVRDTRRRAWDQEKRDLVAERLRTREADEKAKRRPSATKPESDLTLAERDVLARESLLDGMIEGFDPLDPEPVFDCVVWNDGKGWRVLIDTDEDGDLADEVVLRPYGVARETGLFAGQTGSRFAVQVYDEGRLLSIVTVIGSHGTHVAGIASAHFPGEPARNGIAPGAQIVSVKIGDTRMGGSADGTAYLRALAACVQHKVDLMNMSFGGPSEYQDGYDTGNRFIRRLVQDYGVTAFISVGNSGPALSTIGSPGNTPEVIGVGAYVSKEMASALYAAPAGSAATTYGFTSRGPTKAGGLGVDILGPGGAIAPVAFDSLSRTQLMNGTSMSSPSLAGVGALLVSGAKQAGLKTSPARIKAALKNTARPVEGVEPWAQGPGLAQVGPAFEHLRAHQGIGAFDVHFKVETNDNTLAKGDGLYWREGRSAGRQEARFTVAPQFLESVPLEARQAFEDDFILESSAPWVEVPRFLHVANGSRPFSIWVTVPESGPAGSAHFAEIRAVSARNPGAGPAFRIPVTVISPLVAQPGTRPIETFKVSLNAGGIVRAFHQAPPDASHLRLRVRRDRADQVARTYAFRAVSLTSYQSFTDGQFSQALRLDPGEQQEFLVPVLPGRTIELLWHQQWNSAGASQLEGEFSWVGVNRSSDTVVMTDNQKYGDWVLRSVYEALPIEVTGKLTEAVLQFAPIETRTLPGDERDLLPPSPRDTGPIRQPVLRQKFEFKVETAFKAKLGEPRTSLVFDELLGGVTRIVHDSGRVLYNGGRRSGAEIEFPKGTITAYRDLRAIDTADAQRQTSQPLVLRRSLPPSATLGIYPDARTAAKGKREAKLTLLPGRDHDLYFEEPAAAVFKDLTPTPAWYAGEIEVTVEKQTLFKQPVVYHRGVTPAESKRPAGEPAKPKRTPLEDAREELYQKQLSLVRTLREKKDADSIAAHTALLDELRASGRKDPALTYEAILAKATRAGVLPGKPAAPEPETPAADAGDTSTAKAEEGEKTAASSAAAAAPAPVSTPSPAPTPSPTKGAASTPATPSLAARETAVAELKGEIKAALADIDATAVAAFFGAPEATAPDDREAKRALAAKRKEMTSQRELLRDYALLSTELALGVNQTKEARTAYTEALRWEATPATPSKRAREVEFAVLKAEGHLGLALQVFQDHVLKENPLDRTQREKRISLLRELGWTRWADREAYKLAVEKGTVPVRF
ncbi:MAG: S8 family serine peptidase [Opitutaceae bacterium]